MSFLHKILELAPNFLFVKYFPISIFLYENNVQIERCPRESHKEDMVSPRWSKHHISVTPPSSYPWVKLSHKKKREVSILLIHQVGKQIPLILATMVENFRTLLMFWPIVHHGWRRQQRQVVYQPHLHWYLKSMNVIGIWINSTWLILILRVFFVNDLISWEFRVLLSKNLKNLNNWCLLISYL